VISYLIIGFSLVSITTYSHIRGTSVTIFFYYVQLGFLTKQFWIYVIKFQVLFLIFLIDMWRRQYARTYTTDANRRRVVKSDAHAWDLGGRVCVAVPISSRLNYLKFLKTIYKELNRLWNIVTLNSSIFITWSHNYNLPFKNLRENSMYTSIILNRCFRNSL
jgi:hypothetical protein